MTKESLQPERDAEVEDLRNRLAEAEDVLRAIRNGNVDAVIVSGEDGEQVYTLSGADRVYRQLIDTISEGAVTLSAEGVILYGNIRLAEMLGKPPIPVLGTDLRSYLPLADHPTLEAVLTQACTELSRRDINLKTVDGQLLPVRLSAFRLHSEGAETVFCLVLTDLTEHKRHEQVAAADQLSRLILEQAAEAIVVCDEQGRVTRASQAAQQLCDGNPLLRIFAEAFPLRSAAEPFRLAPVLQGETLRNVDVALDSQGQKLDLILNAGPLLDGQQILGCVLSLTDITERKRWDEALRESEERLRSVTAASPTVIYVTTPGLVPTWVSGNSATVLGYSAQECLTPTWWADHLHPDDKEYALAHSQRVLAAGEFSHEYRFGLPTAGYRWVHDEMRLVRDAAGQPNEVVGVWTDVTERKHAEAAHEKLQAQLTQAQKMESVGRLAGGVAHDFNNLLMGIMNYVELCRDEVGTDHPIREWLDEITSDAQRSAEITRQLLAFARKQTIAPKVLDLNDAVAGMLKLLRRLIGEDIDLAWLPGADLQQVKLDSSQVDQILANLCVNARDAIAGVGRITLETGTTTIDAAYCASHPDALSGAYVFLAVSDDGCGMDPETLAQVFEPFFTTKGIGLGTGLGLATVYGIAKQNNGFIHAYSEPDHGTTFKLYLPQVAAEAAAAATIRRAEAPRGHGEIVLLVEDERSLRVTCSLFLEALGYTVLKAETPGEALKTVAGHPGDIHLLLTDVVLPGMDGRQLSERVRAVKPDVKVLFMSGYTADVIAQRGVLEENVAFLNKPFSRDDLAHTVRQVLDAVAARHRQ